MPRKREYEKYGSPGIMGSIFPRSIGRAQYFVRSILLNLLVIIPLSLVTENTAHPLLGAIGALAAILAVISGFWIAIVPRLRDMNYNTKLAWLCLIPGINVFMALTLLFTPGK